MMETFKTVLKFKKKRSLIHFQFIFVYGVRKCSNFILFTYSYPVFPIPFIKEAVFAPLYILASFVEIRYPQVHGFISGFSILLHWSTFLFLCQYHNFLMTVALQNNLKTGSLIPPVPFFFLKTALAIQGLLCSCMNCEIFCSSSVKNAFGNLIGIALVLQTAFGSIVIFTILILPTQEHGISFHLFILSLISFISTL